MLLRKIIFFIAATLFLSSCNSSSIKANYFDIKDHAFLKAGNSKIAVILCHGRDKHPRWKVVEPLRKEINHQLNWHSLSLQMPIGDSDWTSHQYLFPQAFQTIDQGINFLKEKHGVTKIFLLGHSMGSRTGAAYLAAKNNHKISGFIGIGMRNNGGYPLNAKYSLENIKTPVLDLFGDGGNGADLEHANDRKSLLSERYLQVKIKNANHKFTQHQPEMISSVIDWLKDR